LQNLKRGEIDPGGTMGRVAKGIGFDVMEMSGERKTGR
jgi:hypothetical protein